MTIKIFSYGGGVQSTAALVLAAQGRIDYPTFLFANTGDDSEHPATLAYVRDIAIPYAQSHRIELHELGKMRQVRRDGKRTEEPETLYGRLTRPESKSIGIPVRMSGSGAPGNRNCTVDFKVKVIDKWIKQNTMGGMIHEMKEKMLLYFAIEKIDKETMMQIMRDLDNFFQIHEPVAQVGIGISLDEIQRVKPNTDEETIYWKINAHPLVFEVPKPLTRQDCINIIERAGLPIPPKSACYYCPFHSIEKWQDMRTNEPDLFQKACDLEELINKRRAMLGKDPVWLTRKLKPLAQVTTQLEQASLFDDVGCDSGYCWT
jgi:hypothetical protein